MFAVGRKRCGLTTEPPIRFESRQTDLLGPEVVDADGNREDRRNTVSVFNGPPAEVRAFSAEGKEADAVGA